MIQSPIALAAASAFSFATAIYAAQSGILAPGAKLEKLAGGFAFTEGPAADAQGNVYFTDQPNDRHSQVERRGQAFDLHAALRPVQRAVL